MRLMRTFHPDWFYNSRPVVEGTFEARIEVRHPTGSPTEWKPGGFTGNGYDVVFRGLARIQPNINWRARDRDFGNEFTGTQAVLFQLGYGKNELGQDYLDFEKDDKIVVLDTYVDGAAYLKNHTFFVRNALDSSNPWTINLLADGSTKEHE